MKPAPLKHLKHLKHFLTLSTIISVSMMHYALANDDQYDPSQDSFYQNAITEPEQLFNSHYINTGTDEDVEADAASFYQNETLFQGGIDQEEMDEVQYIDPEDEGYYDEN